VLSSPWDFRIFLVPLLPGIPQMISLSLSNTVSKLFYPI